MILKRLKIETMIGNFTNCYIISDEEKKEAMCIDPAGNPKEILETLEILKAKLKYIYLTHCHADHTAGLEEVKEETNAQILIHRKEYENMKNPSITLSGLVGTKDIEITADARVDDGDKLHIGDIECRVIHTPGHTNRRKLIIL